MGILVTGGVIVAIVAAATVLLCSIYKVADVDKALIITGGKEPIIKVSGGGFVIPIFRKHSYFDLCMLTVRADSDEIKTETAVPIVVDWTAQIRPNSKDINSLKKAVVSFKERGSQGIIDDVKLTLMGSVRNIVATMTPEQVQNDKDTFKQNIVKEVTDELEEMGLELVSLNIQDITDRNGYYDDIAAKDREEKRKEAERVRAIADQQIREQSALSGKLAKEKELETELQIAEKQRDNDLKKAGFKAETDKANADAEVAGRLQQTIRQQEIATQEGRVAVVQQEQANLAAQKRQEVVRTESETNKIQAEIKASEEAKVAEINAAANAKVAETKAAGEAKALEAEATGKAKAAETEALGRARAVEAEATGEAKAVEAKATAEANAIKAKGDAEADIIAKKGTAEAEAIRARLLAEAEGEKELAAARASNEKVNFEIEKLKIEANMRVEIATNTAKIMADIGKNAEFVNIGGGMMPNGGTGNVLIDTMSGIPGMMKVLDAQNQALNGKDFREEVSGLVAAVADPIKGIAKSEDTSKNK